MKRSILYCYLIAVTCLVFAPTASASLIPSDPFLVDMGGTGFGDVLSILTLQTPQEGSESGSVSWNGLTDVYTGAETVTGAPHTLTRTFLEIGWTSAEEIMVIYNVNETGKNTSTTIQDLVLSIYNAAGDLVWNSSTFAGLTITEIAQGTGQSGWGFTLDGVQAAALDELIPDFSLVSNYRVGLLGSINLADDGPDTFFVVRLEGEQPPGVVPEPATMVLLGAGLIGLAGFRRKFRKN